MTILDGFRRLNVWEEACGLLESLAEIEELLIAKIGTVQIALPSNLEYSLRPLLGQRIAILRTDLPERKYLFRKLAEEPSRENEAFKER